MTLSRTARWIGAALLGGVTAVATYARVAPIEPHLEIVRNRVTRNAVEVVYDLVVKVRGGEAVTRVSVEAVSGPIHVVVPSKSDLPPGTTAYFRVELKDWHESKGLVRVTQSGRVERTYDVPIEETP